MTTRDQGRRAGEPPFSGGGDPRRRWARSVMGMAAMLTVTPALSQSSPGTSVDGYPGPVTYPREDRAAVVEHLARARRIAGDDLYPAFLFRCITSPRYKPRVLAIQQNARTEPTRIFDNLYSIGQNAVSSYALVTSAGIIVIDALNSAAEAKSLLVPNMERLGLDPKAIRYVLVTHGHGDHYGGARYLQDTYGARVVASRIDWPMILASQRTGMFAGLVPPTRDVAVEDGGTLTLGDETIRLFVTPGHTPGTLSLIFPVRDRGTVHTVGLYGGTGGGAEPASIRAQIASLGRWQAVTRQAGADILVTNHPSHFDAVEKEELLRYAAPGDPNPFLIGRERYQRYFRIMDECSRAQLGRLGEAQP